MTEYRKSVARIQTGVRIEKRILKTLKIIAAHMDMSLGDLLEGIVLNAFEGKAAFGKETLAMIAETRKAVGLDLTAADSHKLLESNSN